MTTSRFSFRTVRSTVAEAHGVPFPAEVRRRVWFFEPTDAAVVLGSTQSVNILDLGALAGRGLGVVRRHSGGGAVVVEPGSASWFDVWLPSDDPLFEHDVSASAVWLGRAVVTALATAGVEARVLEPASFVDGRVDRSTAASWCADLVCFAGVAPGEVVVEGRKAVGISQRRTRAGARFQVSIVHRWDAVATASLFDLDEAHRSVLRDHLDRHVHEVAVATGELRRALEAALSEG